MPPIAIGTVQNGPNGAELAIGGTDIPPDGYLDIVARQDWAVEPGLIYTARWVARRVTNTADPLGDAVQFYLVYENAARQQIGSSLAHSLTMLVASGRTARSSTFSLDQAADFTAPAGTCYVKVMVRLFGSSGRTAIEVIDRVTSNSLPGPKGDVGDVTPEATAARADAITAQTAAEAAAAASALSAARMADLCGVRLSASPYYPMTTVDHAAVLSLWAVPHTSAFVGLYNVGDTAWEVVPVSDEPLGLTSIRNVTVTSGSPVLADVANADRLSTGMLVEGSAIPPGTSVIGISGTDVTLSANATISGSDRAYFKVPANTIFDVGLKSIGGVARLQILQSWASNTERTIEYDEQDGVPVLASDHSVRYFGSFATVDSIAGETRDTRRDRLIWNREPAPAKPLIMEAGLDSWGVNVRDWRIGGGQDARNRFRVLKGGPGKVEARARSFAKCTTADVMFGCGIGVDSPNSNAPSHLDSATVKTPGWIPSANGFATSTAEWTGDPGIGLHSIYWLEWGRAEGDLTFGGDFRSLGITPAYVTQSGMVGSIG